MHLCVGPVEHVITCRTCNHNAIIYVCGGECVCVCVRVCRCVCMCMLLFKLWCYFDAIIS